jgi:hypothetical protein
MWPFNTGDCTGMFDCIFLSVSEGFYWLVYYTVIHLWR